MKSQDKYLMRDLKRQKERWKDLIVCFSILLFVFIFVGLLVSISAITHEYGPYMGKVVYKETGEPIDGAAVLLVFHTESLYSVSSYAGAMETMTNRNGEFSFPKKRMFTFHPLSKWEPYCQVKIFKPGYGSFPYHRESGPKYSPTYSIPENEYYIVQLPKLLTVEERKRNLISLPNIPRRKMKNLIKLKNEERKNIGLTT